MDKCEVCGEQVFKYKCPACGRRTCSLACSKQHKVQENCTGERSKTHYIALENFDDKALMSDYNFLQDVGLIADNSVRESIAIKKAGIGAKKRMNARNMLRKRAVQQGIELVLMPPGMKRQKMNKTQWIGKLKQFQWSIEVVFPELGNASILKHRQVLWIRRAEDLNMYTRIIPTETLRSIIDKFIAFIPSTHPDQATLAKHIFSSNDMVIGLKNFQTAKSPTTFTDLSQHVNETLDKVLVGTKILEFPTLYVWRKARADQLVADGSIHLVEKQAVIAPLGTQVSDKPDPDHQGKEDDEEGAEDEGELEAEEDVAIPSLDPTVMDLDLDKVLSALSEDLGADNEAPQAE